MAWQAIAAIAAPIIGSIISGKANKKAAKQVARGNEQAIGTMKQYLGPYAEAGAQQIAPIQDFVDEGARFSDTQAYKDIVNSARAGGMNLSGNRLTALTDYYATNFRPQRLNELSTLYRGGLYAGNAMATGIGGLQQNVGQANAAGTIGAADAWTSGINALGSLDYSTIFNRNNIGSTAGSNGGFNGGFGAPVNYGRGYGPQTSINQTFNPYFDRSLLGG